MSNGATFDQILFVSSFIEELTDHKFFFFVKQGNDIKCLIWLCGDEVIIQQLSKTQLLILKNNKISCGTGQDCTEINSQFYLMRHILKNNSKFFQSIIDI